MSSGSGRGRGWLNLNKTNAVAARHESTPGLTTPPPLTKEPDLYDDPPSTEYDDLVKQVKQLNTNDDGILFNQKIKHIVDYWGKVCNSKEDAERSFDALYCASLFDDELVPKLVTMVSCHTFLKQEICEQSIRKMFLLHLQNSFENRDNLRLTNPVMFRNTVLLLSEYYNKYRKASGGQFQFLNAPVVSSLEMLLESSDLLDLKLFTTVFYHNGSKIKSASPDKFLELHFKIRSLLASDKQFTKDCKLWLLLALDLSNNGFTWLRADLCKFYEDNLGSGVAIFKYQFSSSPSEISSSDVSSQSDNNTLTTNQLPTNVARRDGREITSGRPILGSGARLNKAKPKEEHYDKRKSHQKHKRKEMNGFASDSTKKPPTLRTNKKWEHDDRFDNDYS